METIENVKKEHFNILSTFTNTHVPEVYSFEIVTKSQAGS